MSPSNCSAGTARGGFLPAVQHNDWPGDKSMNSLQSQSSPVHTINKVATTGRADKLFVRKPHSKAAPVGPNLTIFCH